ncbi:MULTISPECIES: DUF2853 family protein [Sphingobacterium]|jgi:hypothetical protein|uniref:DUF2853 family protein n=2 Tax=Sphingobacterium TaxID=28453 RepID=A0ABW5YYC9_9SPHI|nr:MULTISPECIES: DUF2853 family protein [Sphingobacterium]MBB2952371.1 hypothetical protein [Sphingobacterium sp. JUb56]MCS3553614.1 hypothetical protein [Sphingobacterium sp. JUb21]MCW2260831.1 hypothetical protein [Sphingobacterium kitahiroshimense]NJI75644.1 DUF2853 family protein [Sphingobacterium sp. B16(2022)]QQD14302.1 DUF2853 family protein [Sphingobacterium sp. UDSM-2020]
MSKLDEKISAYIAEAKKLKLSLEDSLIESVTKGLGPSIYKADAETIASSDPEEIKRLKNNFLIKKLGLTDDAKLDAAIEEVFTQIGKSNRNKYRALVYALLVKKFKKESLYK